MKHSLIAIAALASMAQLPTPAAAHGNGWHRYHNTYQPARTYYTDNGIRYWNGRDGRRYCRRSDGTVGMLIGGAAGGLLGRAVDTRGDRAVGTILGIAGGALLGREVARGRARCR